MFQVPCFGFRILEPLVFFIDLHWVNFLDVFECWLTPLLQLTVLLLWLSFQKIHLSIILGSKVFDLSEKIFLLNLAISLL